MLDCALDQIARNASDIERIRRSSGIAAVLDVKGSFDLDVDTAVLRNMYRWGVLSARNWTRN